jgi:hypothetical protein
MRISRLLSILVPLTAPACNKESEQASVHGAPPRSVSPQLLRAHSAVGCWAVSAEDYRGYARIPALVQLSSKYRVTARGDTIGQALIDLGSRGPGLGYADWVPITPTTIALNWGDGLAGVQVHLSGHDTLVGVPADWTDLMTTPRPNGRLTLTRVPCSRAVFTHGMWSYTDSSGTTVRER